MAGSSFFALFDDIATILDDVSVMTQMAAKKTAGVLGDDLALNAQQVAGVKANREIPVVWAVAKGSAINKIILVPTALVISYLAPWAVMILLMIGGAFLCFEGVEKLAHKFLHSKEELKKHEQDLLNALDNPQIDLVALEQEKIKGAIRTDFILSAEIIVITLGTVANAVFATQVLVLILVACLMTVGVYGLVAGIVKLDDLGFYLCKQKSIAKQALGKKIVLAAPYLMRTLSVLGTAAMFLVGGSIVAHGIPAVDTGIHFVAHKAFSLPLIGGLLEAIIPILLHGIFGVLVGALVLTCTTAGSKIFNKLTK